MKTTSKNGWFWALMVTVGLVFSTPSRAALDPATQALVNAGDVDGVAAQLANGIAGGGGFDVQVLLADIARANPDIAGAVLNAAIRNLAASGQGAAQIGNALRDMTSGVLSGLNGTINADDVETYAENVATNIRQAVAAISGGNQITTNNLLASARAGVGQSAAGGGQQGGVAQLLRGNTQTRLAAGIDPTEFEQAPQQEPVVVVHTVAPTGATPRPNPPSPIEPREENPQRDNVSPS